jgi:hypothetical protein
MERGIRRYYLHRWPSARAMKSIRAKVRAKTGRNRTGVSDIREVIASLKPLLRGWGNYFRSGHFCRQVQPDRQLRLAQSLWPDAQALRPQPASGPVEIRASGDLGKPGLGIWACTACVERFRYPEVA